MFPDWNPRRGGRLHPPHGDRLRAASQKKTCKALDFFVKKHMNRFPGVSVGEMNWPRLSILCCDKDQRTMAEHHGSAQCPLRLGYLRSGYILQAQACHGVGVGQGVDAPL